MLMFSLQGFLSVYSRVWIWLELNSAEEKSQGFSFCKKEWLEAYPETADWEKHLEESWRGNMSHEAEYVDFQAPQYVV